MLFDSILLTVELLSKLESLSQTLLLLLQLNLCNFLKLSSLQQSSQHLHRSRFHFKEIFCLSIRSNASSGSSFIIKSQHFSHIFRTHSNSSSLASLTTSVFTSSAVGSNPSKSFIRVGINFFQTPVNVVILTSSHESQMFLMRYRMVNPFQKVFNLLCPDSSEESFYMIVIVL